MCFVHNTTHCARPSCRAGQTRGCRGAVVAAALRSHNLLIVYMCAGWYECVSACATYVYACCLLISTCCCCGCLPAGDCCCFVSITLMRLLMPSSRATYIQYKREPSVYTVIHKPTHTHRESKQQTLLQDILHTHAHSSI